jgi:hypothetical protein
MRTLGQIKIYVWKESLMHIISRSSLMPADHHGNLSCAEMRPRDNGCVWKGTIHVARI